MMTKSPFSDSMRKTLDQLWDAYLRDMFPEACSSTDERVKAGMEMISLLRMLHVEAKQEGDEEQLLKCESTGRAIWGLLAIELGAWFAVEGSLDIDASGGYNDLFGKIEIVGSLELQDIVYPPTHRNRLEWMPIMLPRWAFDDLKNALHALDKGEIHPMLQPNAAGRHGDAWSWDEMRVRGLQHIAFLRGQGVAAGIARRRVGTGMATSPETLRKWERELTSADDRVSQQISRAYEAGELKALEESNPYHNAERDAHAVALIQEFKTQPLSEFGRIYQERFGHRHNSPNASGAD